MRIAVILPRGMTFSPNGASAIDLCVHDFVNHSRHRATTTVIGEGVEAPFPELDFQPVSRDAGRGHKQMADLLAAHAQALSPDLVVVHQHLPIATRIAKRLKALPVILHKHNLPKSGSMLSRWQHERQYDRFAATVWVSTDALQAFRQLYPHLAQWASAVHNGLDFAAWSPCETREKEILVVGRASPEKGILEAAKAFAALLPTRKNWRARFILSRLDRNEAYLCEVSATLAPLGIQASVETDQPHTTVKQGFERAAIAVVPSLFREPFGRTALEAMAGGAALVSSTNGGLAEILTAGGRSLPQVSPQTIAQAVGALIDDEAERKALALNGRENAARQFDIRAVSSRLDDVYETAVCRAPQIL